MCDMNALDKAISLVGGPKALGIRIGASIQAVCNWRVRGVPAEYCPDIEQACQGAVRCEELNPRVNWSYLRGTSKAGKRRAASSTAS